MGHERWRRWAAWAVRPDLEAITLRAVGASGRDPALARMLPVFLWRVPDELDPRRLAAGARRRRAAAALGYLLELSAKLGRHSGFDAVIAELRREARPDRPRHFFRDAARHPFAAMVARERTPPEARRWGLLTGTPTDSFATYFDKVRDL